MKYNHGSITENNIRINYFSFFWFEGDKLQYTNVPIFRIFSLIKTYLYDGRLEHVYLEKNNETVIKISNYYRANVSVYHCFERGITKHIKPMLKEKDILDIL